MTFLLFDPLANTIFENREHSQRCRYHYHTLVNPQIINLLHLAKALTNSMGLNRTQIAYDRGKFFLDGHDIANKFKIKPSHGSEYGRSDGWRALAGCFYLTSAYVPIYAIIYAFSLYGA